MSAVAVHNHVAGQIGVVKYVATGVKYAPLKGISTNRTYSIRVAYTEIGVVVFLGKNDFARRFCCFYNVVSRIEVVATSAGLNKRVFSAIDNIGCFGVILSATIEGSTCPLQVNLGKKCLSHCSGNIRTIVVEGSVGQSIAIYDVQQVFLLFYVFCFFFLAAGNKTLFRINLYPGELG
jgi:hypothetical protein